MTRVAHVGCSGQQVSAGRYGSSQSDADEGAFDGKKCHALRMVDTISAARCKARRSEE